jgi:hypothetical protein
MALNWIALADEIDRERLSNHICGIFVVGRRSGSQFPEGTVVATLGTAFI